MPNKNPTELETDPRFPSGPWTGFFLQTHEPHAGRHMMELRLKFRGGTLTGEGRDRVGRFVVRGRYDTADGKCHWSKRYLGMHDVFYTGYNEGKGIWGTWEIPPAQNFGFIFRGGFHIWPEGMANAAFPQLSEEADPPVHVEELVEAAPTSGTRCSSRHMKPVYYNCRIQRPQLGGRAVRLNQLPRFRDTVQFARKASLQKKSRVLQTCFST